MPSSFKKAIASCPRVLDNYRDVYCTTHYLICLPWKYWITYNVHFQLDIQITHYSNHTLLAQRASYWAPLSSVFGPNSTVNHDFTIANSTNCLLIGLRCLPNAHTLTIVELIWPMLQNLCFVGYYTTEITWHATNLSCFCNGKQMNCIKS